MDFELSGIQKFNCLIGLNGSGKTTLLQAFDFLSQLVLGNMKNWLKSRGWKHTELCNISSQKRLIVFEVKMKNNIEWKGEYNISRNLCSSETISENGKILLKVSDGQYRLENDKLEKIMFDYQGSIMSQLKIIGNLLELKNEINGLKSMELLSPHIMRTSSKEKTEDIGIYGEQIHKFLYSLNKEQRENLTKKIMQFYPNLSKWDIMSQRFGWKKLFIIENYNEEKIRTNANHINDGFLRIIAFLAQSFGKHNILLYDEIENGINPELVEKLIDHLVKSEKQIFVTTHSPLVLNYLDDEVAKKSVRLLYKTKDGDTKSALYFDYPEAKRKLEFFGPGEVYVDTSISDAVDYFIIEANK
jgi:predicted ATPase